MDGKIGVIEREFFIKKEAKEYLAEVNAKGVNAKLYLRSHKNPHAVCPLSFTYIVRSV